MSFLYSKIPQFENVCNICFSRNIKKTQSTYSHEVGPTSYVRNKSMNFTICRNCNYSFCGENFKDYISLGSQSMSNSDKFKRVGDGITPGREFFMTKGAIAIIKREKLKVLVFAPGNSLDHQLIRKIESVMECKITDLKNFQVSDYFIPIEAKEVFDIVIACEVVEHFMSPRKEFSNLFRYLNKNGLLIVSTDTRVSECTTERVYPFLYGHTSYYSGRSLIFLAEMNNMFIDFRTPEGQNFNSKIKRYIYMTKSKETYFKLVERFAVITRPLCE